MEQEWIRLAVDAGFTAAVPADPALLQPRQDVRDMCAQDRCGAYGKNWTCPPHCGELSQCAERLRAYRHGILAQTVGKTEKPIDTKAYARAERQHLSRFHALAARLRQEYPDALCLGAGGCRICSRCAWPEPCRFPDRACSSMEGYGLLVSQVCRDCGAAYYHGPHTVTYTALFLW